MESGLPRESATRAIIDAWQEAWRQDRIVLNATRRFRYVLSLKKQRERDEVLSRIHKFKVGGIVAHAVTKLQTGHSCTHNVKLAQGKAAKHGFGTDACFLSAMLMDGGHHETLKRSGGVTGIAHKLKVSTKNGLSGSEEDVRVRQEVFGSNTYPEKPPKGFWTFVWEAMQDLTLIILSFCVVLSLGVGIATEGLKEGWYDGAGIAFSIMLVVFVTAASDYQQSLQFQDLDKEKKNIFIQVTRSGCRLKISIYDIVVGDVVHLSIGDQVPADGLLISGYSLVIDESSMTGESAPLHKSLEKPFLLSGTKVQDGSGLMVVTGVGMNTEWGHLMATLGAESHAETPLQVKLNGLATFIGKLGLCFAVLTFLVLVGRYLVSKESISHWSGADAVAIVNFFAIAVTIIVVAVPEGLPLAVTLTLAYAMKKMMSDKALVRHLAACETMGSATAICTDKTGTLTTNKMTVVKAWVGGSVRDVQCTISEVSPVILEILFEGIYKNTSGDVGEDENHKPIVIGTPTETAVLGYGCALGGNFKEICDKSEILKCEPFNSARKRMGVVVRDASDGKVRAHWKGASEIVLGMCDKTFDIDGNIVPIDESKGKELTSIINQFADQALRTLCLAYKDIDHWHHYGIHDKKALMIPEDGFVCAAIVGIKDPVRPGVPEAVRLCAKAGIKVRMVTGDNIHTAKAIARECGILTDGEAVEGPDFRNLSPEEMKKRIPKLEVMARSSPTDKLTLVKHLMELGEVVAVTGDGTNDAPALKEADIGMAMGIAGTEVAKDSADIVILDDNFSTIVVVGKWGRAVYTNIQKFVQFQLTVNLVALVVNFTSACITGEAPLTAVQLLWVNLIMDTLGALALATEPPHDDLMDKPSLGRYSSFISNVMWRNILGQVVYQLTVLGILQYKGKAFMHLSGSNSDELLNTMIFNTFVFCQVFNEINAREMEKVNVFSHTFDNSVFCLIVAFTVSFQAILIEFLGKFANTVPLTWQQWLITVSIGSGGLIVAAVVKLIPVSSGTMLDVGSGASDEAPEHYNGYQSVPDGPDQRL